MKKVLLSSAASVCIVSAALVKANFSQTYNKTHPIGNLITLPDGRNIGFQEYGHPLGKPLFFFHDIMGSKFQLESMLSNGINVAFDKQIRIICLDRPGYGTSDYVMNRRLLDWPKDVVAVADALQINKFGVLGYGAGAPYSLACAYAIPRMYPNRLTDCTVVGGIGPIKSSEETSESSFPPFQNDLPNELAIYCLSNWRQRLYTFPSNKGHLYATLNKLASAILYYSDSNFIQSIFHENLNNPTELSTICKMMHIPRNVNTLSELRKSLAITVPERLFFMDPKEASRYGTYGFVRDSQVMFIFDWGFRLQDIDLSYGSSSRERQHIKKKEKAKEKEKTKTNADTKENADEKQDREITIWHGEMNQRYAVHWAFYMADRIPKSRAYLVPQQGHFSLLCNYFPQILDDATRNTPCSTVPSVTTPLPTQRMDIGPNVPPLLSIPAIQHKFNQSFRERLDLKTQDVSLPEPILYTKDSSTIRQ